MEETSRCGEAPESSESAAIISPGPGALRTFHLFPLLPFELRTRIWKLTTEPREVRIQMRPRPGHSGADANAGRDWYAPTPIPSALHACQASRSALTSQSQSRMNYGYTRAFPSSSQSPDPYPRYVWSNFALDTIRIHEVIIDELEEDHSERERLLLRDVVIDSDDICVLLYIPLSAFPCLRRLTILSSENINNAGPLWCQFMERCETMSTEQKWLKEVKILDSRCEELKLENWRSYTRGWWPRPCVYPSDTESED